MGEELDSAFTLIDGCSGSSMYMSDDIARLIPWLSAIGAPRPKEMLLIPEVSWVLGAAGIGKANDSVEERLQLLEEEVDRDDTRGALTRRG